MSSRPQQHSKPIAASGFEAPDRRSFPRNNADLIVATAYFAVWFAAVLPGARIGYDVMHHSVLLANSLRIIEGQTPFKDFYGQYGPLYHYLLAAWVWACGKGIFSIKLYLLAAAPLISMALFIAALRLMRLAPSARVLAVAVSALWGMDRLVHSGSTRSMLGLFCIGWWTAGIGSASPRRAWLARLSVFPLTLICLFYSPDIGVYLFPAALFFAGWDLFLIAGAERKKAAWAYGAGSLISVTALAFTLSGAEWGRTYFAWLAYSSSNMKWAYGLPMPSLAQIAADPRNALYFLPPLIVFGLTGRMLQLAGQGRIRSLPPWAPALGVYGATLYNSTCVRTSPDHLLFALPPTLVLLSAAIARPGARWSQVAFLILAVVSVPFFKNSPPDLRYWKSALFGAKHQLTAYNEGIYTKPMDIEAIDGIKSFCFGLPESDVAFPFNGYEAYRVGRKPLFPFDDLVWINDPARKKLLVERLTTGGPRYLIIDFVFAHWVYTHEDVDWLLDFIATNYQPVKIVGYAVIYKRREQPEPLARLVGGYPGPIHLDRGHGFAVEVPAPPGFDRGFLELEVKSRYRFEAARRFSLNLISIEVDGRPLRTKILADGRSRVRNSLEGGEFRAFLPKKPRSVKIKIENPGILNLTPESVELVNIKFYRFEFLPLVPYTFTYIDDFFLDQGPLPER